MSTHIDRMKTAMFPAEGTRVENVKFFLGNDRCVTAEQLEHQLDRADAQLRSGATLRTVALDGHLAVKAL